MLLDRNIEPFCKYCRHSTHLGNDEVICIKRGIMAVSGNCNAFRYEPTKRVPEVAPSLKVTGFTEEDFEL